MSLQFVEDLMGGEFAERMEDASRDVARKRRWDTASSIAEVVDGQSASDIREFIKGLEDDVLENMMEVDDPDYPGIMRLQAQSIVFRTMHDWTTDKIEEMEDE